MMILTVTLNPALDLTYELDRVELEATNRVRRVRERAGGKGLNVARVLRALGRDVAATGIAGGSCGARIRADLAEAGVRDEMVTAEAESRRTVALVCPGSAPTLLNEPGPLIGEGAWGEFRGRFQSLLAQAQVVTLSGSLPRGLPDSAYRELVERAEGAGVPVILDASGPALSEALAAHPTVVKPNESELAELSDASDPVTAARALLRRGARRVVASLGSRGMVAVSEEGALRAAPPAPVEGNPTGAGDAAVAALAMGLADGAPWEECLRSAVALSASAVSRPLAGEVDVGLAERLLEQIAVEAM